MKDDEPPQVGVVVVTYDSMAALPELLRTLSQYEPGARLVVVDNASPTGPPDLDGAPPGTRLTRLSRNVGFGAACNAGVEAILGDDALAPDVLAFLNPDVRLEGPSISQLALELAARPAVGVATGPLVSPDGAPQPSAWGPTSVVRGVWFGSALRLPRLRRAVGRRLGRGLSTGTTSMTYTDFEVRGHVIGGAMVIRHDCWQELGGFDPAYFMYWEDADLCHRARQAGWEVRVLPCTPVVHDAGTSSAGVMPEQRWRWYLDGAATFADKHLSQVRGRSVLGALRLGRGIARLAGRL